MDKASSWRVVAAAALALAAAPGMAAAQQDASVLGFFVTSVGGPQGANYGGLEGADRHCQTLAAKAGAGAKTWRAYLSTQAADGKPAINARDRIGKGPWQNAKGVVVVRKIITPGETVGASGTLPLAVVIGRADATEVQVRGKPFDLAPVARDNVARFEVK